jgi:hypothetical protein
LFTLLVYAFAGYGACIFSLMLVGMLITAFKEALEAIAKALRAVKGAFRKRAANPAPIG